MATRYDIGQLKNLASGRWSELLGLDSLLTNGQHYPCPKCGGKDRFRALDDFDQSGAVICNKCFSKDNGDGIATYSWLNGCTFIDAVSQLASKLGLQAVNQVKGGPSKPKASKIVSQFQWQKWNESLAAIFCARKGGIEPSSLLTVNAKMARHFDSSVLALPIRNQDGSPIGYTLAAVSGGKIAIQHQDRDTEWTSWKNVIESAPKDAANQAKPKGIIGTQNLFNQDERARLTRIFKTEGPSDLLALIPYLQPGEGAFCNPCGAKENPANFSWLLEWLDGKQVIVIHDCDEAGVFGARGDQEKGRLGWATWAAQCAKSEVRNVELPYEFKESHGADFRQWVIDGGNRIALEKLIESAEIVEKPDDSFSLNEHDNDPHRLARLNLNLYQSKHGRKLVFWRDEWWRWKRGKYARIEFGELRAKVTTAIREEFEAQFKQDLASYTAWKNSSDYDQDKDKGPPKVNVVTRTLVHNVIGAMEGMTALPGSIEMPSWIPDRSRRHYVSMGNGILDLEKVCDGKPMEEFLLPHSPHWFSSFQLRYDYSKSATCSNWLNYLDFVMDGDRDRIAILQEWAGYLLTSTNSMQKFLVLEGEGQNGKTVYFAAIRAMLGEENVASVSIENFGGRFDLEATLGKAANISGDIGELDNVAEGVLKQFTGGDTMMFDRKNRQPVSARPTAKLMAAWNKRPRFKDRSYGLWRRMILIPFNRQIPPERRVMGMDEPDWWINSGEAPGILRWAIVGLDRLKTNREFTHSKVCERAIADYRRESNPANDFLLDHIQEVDYVYGDPGIECGWLYKLYSRWCIANGNRPLANCSFGKEVFKAFPRADKDRNSISRKWEYTGIGFSVATICGLDVYEKFD